MLLELGRSIDAQLSGGVGAAAAVEVALTVSGEEYETDHGPVDGSTEYRDAPPVPQLSISNPSSQLPLPGPLEARALVRCHGGRGRGARASRVGRARQIQGWWRCCCAVGEGTYGKVYKAKDMSLAGLSP